MTHSYSMPPKNEKSSASAPRLSDPLKTKSPIQAFEDNRPEAVTQLNLLQLMKQNSAHPLHGNIRGKATIQRARTKTTARGAKGGKKPKKAKAPFVKTVPTQGGVKKPGGYGANVLLAKVTEINQIAHQISFKVNRLWQATDPADQPDLQAYVDDANTHVKGALIIWGSYVLLPDGNRRSQTGKRDGALIDMENLKKQVNAVKLELDEDYNQSEGGFGAKGRAHARETSFTGATTNATIADNSYLSNVQISGQVLPATAHKAPMTKNQASGPATVTTSDLNDLEKFLSPINTPQSETFKDTPLKKDRGKGQFAAMHSTNAAGYAKMMNAAGWQNQKWEWLHIRGAGIGGTTDSTNLVAGVYDANTHMIPFESNIRALGTKVKSDPNYSQLDVTWSVSDQVQKHAYRNIKIKWELIKANLFAKNISGEATFKPLQTGTNISKDEIDKLENALSTART